MNESCHTPGDAEPVDPRIDGALRHIVAVGAVLVLLLPAARESHVVLGWLPLWLLAMPMTAWWALHRFAWPRQMRRAPGARNTVLRRTGGSATARPWAMRNRYRRPQRPMSSPLSRATSGSRVSG